MQSASDFVSGIWRQGTSIICALLLIAFPFGVPLSAQNPVPDQPPASQPPPQQLLTPEQLDNLVAPIALYPDALLSQVLVASTYPLEIVEASQWLQQHRNLRGQQLVDAARHQNWDPSVQALVVFPDVVGRLSSNISWTTDLGNAFLAQQADVMNSVQQMRARARAAGKLGSDAEQRVTVDSQGDRTVIEIVPANPQVIYVPQYNPEFIWGPPFWGYYPALYYPAIGFGFGFGTGIFLSSFFGGWGGWGWGGLGGWGWGPNWFGHSIVQNSIFFNRYGFHNFGGYGGGHGGGYDRGGAWTHNPYHRLGVPYPSQGVGSRFGGSYAGRSGAGARYQGGASGGGWRTMDGAGYSGSRTQTPRVQSNTRASASGGGGQWSHFSGNSAAPSSRGGGGSAYRSNSSSSYSRGPGVSASRSSPSSSYSRGSGSAYRSSPSPSYSGGGGFSGRSTQTLRSAPSYNGGGARAYGGSRPSFGGGGGMRSSGGGGGFRGSGGGPRSGGGGSHGGGGSRGGRR